MIPESAFFFAIAGLSASLAGLAGLVAGLRRSDTMPASDLFRLREIVEFCFANVLLALSVFPLAVWLGSLADAARVVAIVAVIYVVAVIVYLRRRQIRLSVASSRTWYAIAIALDVAAVLAALVTIATGATAPLEALLIVLLGRPMSAFLLVLESFEAG